MYLTIEGSKHRFGRICVINTVQLVDGMQSLHVAPRFIKSFGVVFTLFLLPSSPFDVVFLNLLPEHVPPNLGTVTGSGQLLTRRMKQFMLFGQALNEADSHRDL